MPNPFVKLQPALRVLAEEGHVLPATGQAVIDQAIPDLEEMYDRSIGGREEVNTIWESPNRSLYQLVTPIPRCKRSLFRFFLDGSTRTYFIGTVLEHERSSPVQISQVGAAAVCRESDGQLRIASVRRKPLLADLQESHRTCVFPRWPGESREGKIVFWYVRIRPQKALDYPLMGVVKVEMPNPSREPVDSEVVDLISGALVAERSVTPHGRDSRWHAHLYPIYIAERVIKDQFYSQEVLKAAIRWPELRPAE
jgi:hypothetical protein